MAVFARKAVKKFPRVREALYEFEILTKRKVTETGCSCADIVHTFWWLSERDHFECCSSNRCLKHLYDNIPESYREAVRLLNGAIQ